MEKHSKIYVAGHRGMVGSSIVRKLKEKGHDNIVLKTSTELDLMRQDQVEYFFKTEQPEYVFLAAAKVGGIQANNSFRGEFLYNNLMIQNNVIHQSYATGVKKLLFLGSSCIYPKQAPQPLKEEYLLTSSLESTNEPYAIAKIAGIKMCEAYRDQYGCNFISAMPTNLYGPGDNYNLNTSHVLPALLRKFHEAKENNEGYVEIWGSGTPRREFLHVDDLAEACYFLMNHYNDKLFVNIGSGEDLSIKELALLIQKIVGFKGELKFDTSKPDGTLRKLMDVNIMKNAGWSAVIGLEEGIERVYQAYKKDTIVNK